MTKKADLAFVAYPSRDRKLADIILDAIKRANALKGTVRFEPWEFKDIPGNSLISPILDSVDQSRFIVADISYLNLNVVYEVGFAIGRSKRAFLIRHKGTDGHRDLARIAGIFDTLGYHEYEDGEDLKERLAGHIEPSPLPLNLTLDRHAPVYLVEPPTRSISVTTLISRLKKARYRYRSFSPSEDSRLSATDAIRQVGTSSAVVLPLEEGTSRDSTVHNIRLMFTAGLAHGMKKPCLIMASSSADVPLDIKDEAKIYGTPDDIANIVAEFVPQIAEYLQRDEPVEIGPSNLLQTISIGDPMAENEMTTLFRYYLRTDQYQRTLRGDVNLVVGRKGSGKTALFVQARDKIRADKRNIVVDLKPEGYQLIKLKEEILSYLTDGARQHLITAFWDYLILLEVAYKILEKDRGIYKHNHQLQPLYIDLDRTYNQADFASQGDFSERLLVLSQKLSDAYEQKYGRQEGQRLTAQEVTGLLYSHDIKQLREKIASYLKEKKAVWVLFDNLDKGWSTQGVEALDAVVLRCLIDAGRKIEREMRRAGQEFHCIVFVRNDVYEHLMRSSADFGKEMRAVLDWTDADLLRTMLKLRLAAGIGEKAEGVSFEQIWSKLCISHYRGEETSSYMIERSLMRPRNLLKIFNHCRGFAVNFGRQRIAEEDIEKGLKAYSDDLISELSRELVDVFPEAADVIYHLLEVPSVVSAPELQELIAGAGVEPSAIEKVIDFLLYYGVLGVRGNSGEAVYIYSVNYNLKMLTVRAQRSGAAVKYVVNPAFWPALGIGEK